MTMPVMRLRVVASHGHEVHAALGAVTRLVGDDLRVHRAGVLGSVLIAGPGICAFITPAVMRLFTLVDVLLSHEAVSITVIG